MSSASEAMMLSVGVKKILIILSLKTRSLAFKTLLRLLGKNHSRQNFFIVSNKRISFDHWIYNFSGYQTNNEKFQWLFEYEQEPP